MIYMSKKKEVCFYSKGKANMDKEKNNYIKVNSQPNYLYGLPKWLDSIGQRLYNLNLCNVIIRFMSCIEYLTLVT